MSIFENVSKAKEAYEEAREKAGELAELTKKKAEEIKQKLTVLR